MNRGPKFETGWVSFYLELLRKISTRKEFSNHFRRADLFIVDTRLSQKRLQILIIKSGNNPPHTTV